MTHYENRIQEYGDEQYHRDVHGNEVEKQCPDCRGTVGVILDITGKLIRGQCVDCGKILDTVAARRYLRK